MTRWKAIFFDCDGVLVDSEEVKYRAWCEALSERGIDFSREEYAAVVGLPTYIILERLSREKGREISADVVADFKERYHAMQEKEIPLFVDAIALVKRLAEERDRERFRLGLVSGGSHHEIGVNLRHAGLENLFDCVISGEEDLHHVRDPEGTNKPKPYIYRLAAERLGLHPSECLVFEDTEAGVLAATRAGMVCIGVPHRLTKRQDFSAADRVVESMRGLDYTQLSRL